MSPTAAPSDTRSLAAKVIIWLLFVQSLALLGLGVLNFLNLGTTVNLLPTAPNSIFVENLTSVIIFAALACLGFVTTFYFWRQSQVAWTIGMLLQGLVLFTALIIYFERNLEVYAYPLMAYGTIMVIYLHLPEVIGTFSQTDEDAESQ